MRSHLAHRLHHSSISAVPPPLTSSDYSLTLARVAASILYRSPLPARSSGHPVFILNAAAFPDAHEVDYDALLPYVLARLPGEEELVKGTEYEVVFFAGGGGDSASATATKKNRPGWGWFIQAYHVLSRAMRKRIKKLYIVHERSWVRILVEMFSTIVSPKFRRKIVHVSTLTGLALHIPIEDLLVPSSAYLHDRRLSPDIHAPYASGRRVYGARQPLPMDFQGRSRLPRVLRECTSFVLLGDNIKTEGIFRISPHARLKEILREAYDRGQKYIIWREQGRMLPVPHYEGAEDVDDILKELDQSDTYGVHLAAGLIKLWYAELRNSIFPQACYRDLKRLYGTPEDQQSLKKLVELVSPNSEWSVIPITSREILVRHLLPLLSRIASQQEANKMTPENLAVCIAPALACGTDQLEDVKIHSIVRRLLESAIESWETGLRAECGVDANAFEQDLQPPPRMEDYEDPLDAMSMPSLPTQDRKSSDVSQQETGIIMLDNEPPPLPPRPSASQSSIGSPVPGAPNSASESTTFMSTASRSGSGQATGSFSDQTIPRRKPAPPLATSIPQQQPPRYSTVVANDLNEVAESPTSYVPDGFAPPRRSGFSIDDVKKEPPKDQSDDHEHKKG